MYGIVNAIFAIRLMLKGFTGDWNIIYQNVFWKCGFSFHCDFLCQAQVIFVESKR